MKLFMSATSPFARKVRICAIELGLIDRIELVPTAVAPGTPGSVTAPDSCTRRRSFAPVASLTTKPLPAAGCTMTSAARAAVPAISAIAMAAQVLARFGDMADSFESV